MQEDEIGGFRIPAKTNVILSPYATHRHPQFWERPDEFDPERFTPDQVATRPKYAYFPFIGGPHQCIGNEFAMFEMQLIVALISRRFRLVLQPGQSIRPKAQLTLRPEGPIRMMLESRH